MRFVATMLSSLAALPLAALLVAPGAARAAAPQVASDVFVERLARAPGGGTALTLERADHYRSGDRLVVVVAWRDSGTKGFTVTNPMPRAVAWQRSSDGDEEVSIDGGRSWGKLDELRVREPDGRIREAVPEDVTHVRWRVPTRLAALGSGRITWRGIVR